MSKLQKCMLQRVAQLEPYAWEESSDQVRKKYGVERIVRYDSNTMPTPPGCYDRFLDFLARDRQVNEYKDFSYNELRALIAEYTKIEPEQVFVAEGGDEVIDAFAKAFLSEGDKVVVSKPTYSAFYIQCEINGGVTVDVPLLLPDFRLDVAGLVEASRDAKILYVCNPNNPTATVNTREDIETVVRDAQSMVMVDEAYFEFNARESVQDLIDEYDNLIILRTFSKFAAIAGARVGYALTSPYLAKRLDCLRLPMGISYFSMEVAKMVLREDMAWVESNLHMILSERERMAREYVRLGLEFYPSQTNFYLVRFGAIAKQVVEAMKKKGLILRDRSSKKNIEGCVRIGIRSPEENDILLKNLKEVLDVVRA